MAKKKAITGFRGIALAEVTVNTVLGYTSSDAVALPYAGSMSRTPKERTGDIFYDDDIYAMVSDIMGEEVEIRVGEVSLEMLGTLGLGTYTAATNRIEANFGVAPKAYSLRCVTDTVDNVPYYFNWRLFELGSVRFDNFATKNNSVSVCEVILKGLLKKPLYASAKPLAIIQLDDDGENQTACDAFMADGETLPAAP